MKKILFLQPSYAHYREDLFALLSKRHKIHFLFEKSLNTYPGLDKPKEIEYTFLDKKCKKGYFGLMYFLFKYNYNIIIVSGSKSLRTIISFVCALLLRKKIILWTLEWQMPLYKKNIIKSLITIIKHFISRIIIFKADALVVGGKASRKYALSLRKKEKDIFLATQCSKDIDKQKEYFQYWNIVKNKYTFLFLSRIISWKGLDVLIKAFHLLRQKRSDVSLLIAGEGPSKEYCYDLTKSLNVLDVKFIGSIIPDRTKEIYKKADVFVLPSYELNAYYEAWGLVINEAMSMKLPVITTTAVGASFDMIIDGYNGLVVRENSVNDLYKAMTKILKYDLIQMGINSRKIFERINNYSEMANGFSDAIAYVDC